MAKRDNHYEAAFEEYLRSRRVPYVAVNEKRRSLLGGASLKSLDFIVSPAMGGSWLVDVKGRHFPAGTRGKQYWKNWSTRDDLRSLWRWERLFGDRFAGLFVFAYQVVADRSPVPAEQLFSFRDQLYGFIGIRVADYLRHAKQLSAAWDTVTVPVINFRELAAPVEWFFEEGVQPIDFDASLEPWQEDLTGINVSDAQTQLAEILQSPGGE